MTDNTRDNEDRRGKITINHQRLLKHINPVRDWRDNWQLKVISLFLAVALWFYIHS